jgi:hypothetical protein
MRLVVLSILPLLRGRKVLMHEDNQVVAILSHLMSRSPAMMDELRKLWELIDTDNINIRARYIRSAANVWADRLSRETDKDDWQLKPRITPCRAPTPSTCSPRKATRRCHATIPASETQPLTASIFPTTFGRRRPTSATHIVRSFPTTSESYANLAPMQHSSRHTSPPNSGINY